MHEERLSSKDREKRCILTTDGGPTDAEDDFIGLGGMPLATVSTDRMFRWSGHAHNKLPPPSAPNAQETIQMRRSRSSTPLLATTRPLTFCQLNEAAIGGALARMVPIEVRLVHYVGGFSEDAFKICKEYLRPFKKTLQRLNLPKDYPKERKLICTRKNLNILGDHINMFLLYYCKTWELKHWKKMLWRFVSLFSTLDEKQLYKLYRYSKTDQFTKFLKVYCRLEYADMANLPSNKKWAKLRDRWRLASCGVKMQEGCLHSLPESWDFPEGNMPTERCSTTQEKEVTEQHCATCDVFDALSVTANEETASSSSSNLY